MCKTEPLRLEPPPRQRRCGRSESAHPTPSQCTEQARPTAARARRTHTLLHEHTRTHAAGGAETGPPGGPPFPWGLVHSQGVAGDLRQTDITLWPKGCALLGPFCHGLPVRPHVCRACCGHGLRPGYRVPPREPPRRQCVLTRALSNATRGLGCPPLALPLLAPTPHCA